MTFSAHLVRPRPFDPSYPADDIQNALALSFRILCANCHKPSPVAATESQALAQALAHGWAVQIKADYHLLGVITSDHVRHMAAKAYCARCSGEFLET
jgi:hypothetical protein